MDESKSILIKRLENLLGFDDSVDDILEQLLQIESSEDLQDYLSQLLGSDNDDVQTFVNDVGKYKGGESLVAINNSIDSGEEKKEEEEKIPIMYRTHTTKKRNNKAKQATTEGKKSNGASRKNKLNNTPKVIKNKETKPAVSAKSVTMNMETKAQSKTIKILKDPPPSKPKNTCIAIPTTKKKEEIEKISKPMKGQASYICGCFGTVHKALTNCLNCGRISCIKEGYDYCPFCGFLVDKIGEMANAGENPLASDKAWQHKERLLRFDRDSARRTVIWDDQEDYFSSSKSTWLSEEEKTNAHQKETERNKKLHERQKQTLNIVF
mmetsp:Transcript_23048/g.26296  ORF Transcript_23048/g.26296 Transcript_23048/m.26296 type:complete len:323 (-) Transcript_23048:154-1122(-)